MERNETSCPRDRHAGSRPAERASNARARDELCDEHTLYGDQCSDELVEVGWITEADIAEERREEATEGSRGRTAETR